MELVLAGELLRRERRAVQVGGVGCGCEAEHAVEPGDLLTTAERPGFAMPVRDASAAQGATIGKAMTALEKGSSGLVLVLVNLR